MVKAWCSTDPLAGLWTAVCRQMMRMGRRGKDEPIQWVDGDGNVGVCVY